MKNSQKSNRGAHNSGNENKQTPTAMQDQDFIRIQNLVQLAKKNDISELSFERKDYKLTIKRGLNSSAQIAIPQAVSIPAPPSAPPVTQSNSPTATPEFPVATPPPATPSNLHTVKCPIPGTFYRRPAPDKPCFVEVGNKVKVGDVLCIVEAMKLFNNIECDIEGKVEEILVEDGSPVEFDQPLFTISK